VDAYLAVGPETDDGACQFSPISYAGINNCSIWRLRVDLATGKVTDSQIVVESSHGYGGTMPAISPDGSQIAYMRTTNRPPNSLWVKATGSSAPTDHGKEWTPGLGPAQFPAWRDNEVVVFGKNDGSYTCLDGSGRCTAYPFFETLHEARASASAAPLFLGAEKGGMSWSDPEFRPTDRNYLAGHVNLVDNDPTAYPTCDPSNPGASTTCPTARRGVPTLAAAELSSGKVWRYQLTNTEPGHQVPLSGCAHAAWRPDGEAILCTEHKTEALGALGLHYRLYEIPFDPSAPAGVVRLDTKPMFTHKPVKDLFTLPSGEECSTLVYKYAQYCGDGDHVIATATCDCRTPACQARGRGGKTQAAVGFARVFLIDRTRPEQPVYHDLTSATEDIAGVGRGGYGALTGTCVGG
jgi:hypothetical protein